MISDLPGDLESEILSRVPAKSLVKFRGTCKRWYALFKDPKFAKKNQGKSARELILPKNFRVYSVIVNRHGIHKGIDPSMEFRGKLNTLKDSKDYKISEIFQYEDLILCVTKGNTRLVVWNPCTGETRWIKPSSVNRRNYLYALGYGNSNSNSSCRSYKILRFCRYQKLLVTEFEMYEFSSDSWRVLDGFTDNWCLSSRGVSLKENAYWIALDKEIGYFLLSFDFTTERFERLPLPYESHNWEDTAVLSVVKDERLSVLYQSISVFTAMMKIWVTNKIADTKDMSWSNFLVVDFEKFMLPCVTNVISFFLDEENKVAVCCDKDMDFGDIAGGERTRIYIVGEDIYKEAYKETTKETLWNWSLFVSYVPSLVHIEENTLKRQKKMNEKEVGTAAIFVRSTNELEVKLKPKGQSISKYCRVVRKIESIQHLFELLLLFWL